MRQLKRQPYDPARLPCDVCAAWTWHHFGHILDDNDPISGRLPKEMYVCQRCGNARQWGTITMVPADLKPYVRTVEASA